MCRQSDAFGMSALLVQTCQQQSPTFQYIPIKQVPWITMNQWSSWRLRTRKKSKNWRKTKRRTWAESRRRNAACATRVCNPAGHKGKKRKEKEEEKGKEEKEGAKHLTFKNLVVLSKRSLTSQEKRRKSPSYSDYSDDCMVWRVWEDALQTPTRLVYSEIAFQSISFVWFGSDMQWLSRFRVN